MRPEYTTTRLILHSKTCSGNASVLQTPSPRTFKISGCRHQLARECTVFCNDERILLTDYRHMPHKATITGVYYSDLPHKLNSAIKVKCRGKLTQASGIPTFARQCTCSQVTLDKLLHLNAYLKKCAFHHILLIWHHLFPNLKNTSEDRDFRPLMRSRLCDRGGVVQETVRNILFYRHQKTPTLL